MAPHLPSRPSLEHLRNEAKALLKTHRRGDASACATLRLLRRFARASDEEILSAKLSLHEVQYALALDYGFKSWADLKRYVETARVVAQVKERLEAAAEKAIADRAQALPERLDALRTNVIAEKPLELDTDLSFTLRLNETVRFDCTGEEHGLHECLLGLLDDGLYEVWSSGEDGPAIGGPHMERQSASYRQPGDGVPYLAVMRWTREGEALRVKFRVESDPARIHEEEVIRAVASGDWERVAEMRCSVQLFDLLELIGAPDGPPQEAAPPPGSWAYVAVNADRELVRGTIEAAHLDDFMAGLKDAGLMAVSVRTGGEPEGPAARTPLALARHTIELVLLRTLRLGWEGVCFDCSGPSAVFQSRIARELPLVKPFPTEVPGRIMLTALRAIAEEMELGSGTVTVWTKLRLGADVPGARPRAAEVNLQSDEREPGVVSVWFALPGSRGAQPAAREEILARVCSLAREGRPLHVLTSTEAAAEQLARALTERLGPAHVGLVARDDKAIPDMPVVVSTAAEMCFAYLRAQREGDEPRDAMEDALENTQAVCVDVSREYGQTPCQIRRRDGTVEAEMRIEPFLMLYGAIVEYEQESAGA